MLGFLMAALAGAAMSVQGVMNTRLSEKIGLLESNAYVQGTAFVLSALAMWFFGKGNLKPLAQRAVAVLAGRRGWAGDHDYGDAGDSRAERYAGHFHNPDRAAARGRGDRLLRHHGERKNGVRRSEIHSAGADDRQRGAVQVGTEIICLKFSPNT